MRLDRIVPALTRIASRLPLSLLQSIAARLADLVFATNAMPAQVARINIAHCMPDYPDPSRLARQSLIHSAQTFLETGIIWERPVSQALQLIREVEGDEEIGHGQRGVIFLSPHLGNWELLGLYLASRYTMAAMYTPPKRRELETWMRQVRGRNGSELVPATSRGVLRLVEILRTQGTVGILPDQDPERSAGVFAPFFGIPANTLKLVPKLAQRSGAEVCLCVAQRLPAGRGFRVVFRPAGPGIYDTDLGRAAASMNRDLEALIRETPEQYQWAYKRFKRRPDHQRHFYPD